MAPINWLSWGRRRSDVQEVQLSFSSVQESATVTEALPTSSATSALPETSSVEPVIVTSTLDVVSTSVADVPETTPAVSEPAAPTSTSIAETTASSIVTSTVDAASTSATEAVAPTFVFSDAPLPVVTRISPNPPIITTESSAQATIEPSAVVTPAPQPESTIPATSDVPVVTRISPNPSISKFSVKASSTSLIVDTELSAVFSSAVSSSVAETGSVSVEASATASVSVDVPTSTTVIGTFESSATAASSVSVSAVKPSKTMAVSSSSVSADSEVPSAPLPEPTTDVLVQTPTTLASITDSPTLTSIVEGSSTVTRAPIPSRIALNINAGEEASPESAELVEVSTTVVTTSFSNIVLTTGGVTSTSSVPITQTFTRVTSIPRSSNTVSATPLSNSGANNKAIMGGSIAGVLFLLIGALVAGFSLRRRRILQNQREIEALDFTPFTEPQVLSSRDIEKGMSEKPRPPRTPIIKVPPPTMAPMIAAAVPVPSPRMSPLGDMPNMTTIRLVPVPTKSAVSTPESRRRTPPIWLDPFFSPTPRTVLASGPPPRGNALNPFADPAGPSSRLSAASTTTVNTPPQFGFAV